MITWRQGAICWLLLAVLGCGCSYSREWRAASRQAAPTNDITGAWVGVWQNSNNDHTDRLIAVISRVSETEYHARFKAWWLGILSGTFEATLTGRWEDNAFVFSGTQQVMRWTFSQEGRADPRHFQSEYSSDSYRGIFSMTRPPAP